MSKENISSLPEDELPQEVVAEVRRHMMHQVSVPVEVDQAILADARAILKSERPVRNRFGWRQWTVGLVSTGSLAAALLIAVLPPLWNGSAPNTESHLAMESGSMEESDGTPVPVATDLEFVRQDIDQSGHIDILDAFALARQISSVNGGVDGDQNGDGVVDDSDVNLIAMTAVML